MSANVESMFFTGELPWHGLGTKLDNPATAEEAIIAAELDWTVRLEPVYFYTPPTSPTPFEYLPIPDHRAIVRTKDNHPFTVVSDRYKPLQNHEAFSFFDAAIGTQQAIYHTAGSLGGGKRVWILAKLPDSIEVATDDLVDKYVLLANSHDGSLAITVKPVATRVVCQNTLSSALAEGTPTIRVEHRGDLQAGIQDATQALGIVNQQFGRAGEQYRHLAQNWPAPTLLDLYLVRLFPDPTLSRRAQNHRYEGPTPATKKSAAELLEQHTERIHKIRSTVRRCIHEGIGSAHLPHLQGSWWAAYNGVTQYLTWHPKSPGRRMESLWFGQGQATSRKALGLALELSDYPDR